SNVEFLSGRTLRFGLAVVIVSVSGGAPSRDRPDQLEELQTDRAVNATHDTISVYDCSSKNDQVASSNHTSHTDGVAPNRNPIPKDIRHTCMIMKLLRRSIGRP